MGIGSFFERRFIIVTSVRLVFFCFVILGLGLFLKAHALFAAPVLRVDAGLSKVDLSPYLEFLEERGKRLSIRQVSAPPLDKAFRPTKVINFGFDNKHPCWVRFKVNNTLDKPVACLLEIAFPFLDHIELYEPTEKGSFKLHKAGRALPFHLREIKHRNFLFHVKIPKGLTTFYVRIHTESAMYFPMTLWNEHVFWKADHEAQFVLGLYYGIMLVMALYNLFIFFSLRDRAYLFYVLYIVSFALYQMTANGLAYEYLWPGATWWNRNSTLFLAGVTMIWAIFFTKFFLSTRSAVPFLDRVLNWITLAAVALAALSLVISYGIMLKVTLIIVAFFVTFLLLSGFVCMRRGQRSARYYILAWTALLTGVMILILWNVGWLPSRFWSIYSIQFGSVLDVVLLSLALADRINELRTAREQALRAVMAERTRAQEQREEMVRELHDGIGAIATNIGLLAEKARLARPSGEVEKDLETISQLAKRGRTEIRSFMECLDEGDQRAGEFISDLRYLGSQLLSGNGISFALDDSGSSRDAKLSPFVRLNVMKVFQEALTNVQKHSGASRVEARIKVTDHDLELVITDNGCGFLNSSNNRGRGLNNMKKRAESMAGRLEIKEEGKGGEVRLHVPLFKGETKGI